MPIVTYRKTIKALRAACFYKANKSLVGVNLFVPIKYGCRVLDETSHPNLNFLNVYVFVINCSFVPSYTSIND